jgi:hypothetical protein
MENAKKGMQASQGSRAACLTYTVAKSWPTNLLPVEIFTLIIGYLPRSNIQNMRLVNKEFEEKVSEYLFRVVVVPFKPEIYGIAPEPGLGAPILTVTRSGAAVMLQDKGMRVFQGFGRRIRKFAMSFEFEEGKLANPPLKNDQEAITSFWGIYRWPYQKYNRYQQLEGLEQTADETRTMAKALRFIDGAKELGLSIDGGLGWLAGPDLNKRVMDRGQKFPVFGESRFVPEPPPSYCAQDAKPVRLNLMSLAGHDNGPSTFERMLQEAGYVGEELESSVRMLVETEDAAHQAPRAQLLESLSNVLGWQGFGRGESSSDPMATPVPSFSITADEIDNIGDGYESEENEGSEAAIPIAANSNKVNVKSENYSLKPNDLSNAQREMLLEIEWAQRAFMQSYAIAIIDNPLTFHNIDALTIARLPNRHLPILRREDFWGSLPQLSRLSLAIIPCWREVAKLPTSWVQDIRIAPSESVSGVYQILNDQIARRKNIKTLNFEWLCGGEDAPGLFTRNQHIVAAPLVSRAKEMINRAEEPLILLLPYVQHLSLKNCWVSPHILTKFGVCCRKTALQTLTLNSVSLSANVPNGAQPNPAAAGPIHVFHAAPPILLNFANPIPGQPAAAPQTPAVLAVNIPTNDWLQPPRTGSWAAVIEMLTPGYTLAQQRYLKDLGPEPSRRNTGRLTKLEFISCGYVRLPLEFDQSALDPLEMPAAQTNNISKRINEIEALMMKPNDHMLGIIINHIDAEEVRTLENGFLLTTDWDFTDQARSMQVLEAAADGITRAGQGRFQGVIEKSRSAP